MSILVLNVGLSNVRSIIFDQNYQEIANCSRSLKTEYAENRVEQNPADWTTLSKECIAESIQVAKQKSTEIKYFTITTSASCLVAINESKNAHLNSILVSDPRAKEEAVFIDNLNEFKKLKPLGFKSSPDLMLPKILWLSKKLPEKFSQSRYFGNVSDFLYLFFTGELISDPLTALKFFYDIEKKSYPMELLKVLNIQDDMLPKVKPVGSHIGYIKNQLCDELGIPKSCKVVLSTYDALAATIGNGALNTGDAVDISGTVTSFRVVSNYNIQDSKERFYSVPHIVDNKWLLGGSNNQGGGIIEWTKTSYYQDVQAEQSVYETMETEAKSISPCRDGLIFLPHLLGERVPVWNPNSKGVFFGITPNHKRPNLCRAIFESLAFSVYHIISTINELGVDVSNVSVSGGLSQFDLVNQIKSDLFDVEIKQFDSFETTAIGAAMIALQGQNIFSTFPDALNMFIKTTKVFTPNAQRTNVYRRHFDLYKNVYESLIPSFELRAKIEHELKHK